MSNSLLPRLFGIVIGIAGLVLIYHAIGGLGTLGIFLLLWSNNIDSALRGKR